MIDDEALVARAFRHILNDGLPGLQVDCVHDGSQAMEAFQSKHHGVLILDLLMPVMDGLTTFDAIRRFCNEHQWEMPSVVFCTALTHPSLLKGAILDNPANCLLRKPVRADEILEAVRCRL